MRTSFEFTAEVEIGGDWREVDVSGEGEVWWENYGADADGNRGVRQQFVEVGEVLVVDRETEKEVAWESMAPGSQKSIMGRAEEEVRESGGEDPKRNSGRFRLGLDEKDRS